MVFESILDPIFSPLLRMPPILAIFIISFVITLAITIVYKYTTDQKKMKKLKTEMKEFQKKIKEMSKKNPQKAMELQQKAMKGNMDYMKSSFKSTLYTILPILIIFGWLNAHMAYYPVEPGQQFNVTAFFDEGHADAALLETVPELEFLNNKTQQIEGQRAVWKLKGGTGEYKLTIKYNNEEYEKSLIISNENYAEPEKKISDSKLNKIEVGNKPIRPLGDFSLFGWKPNWLWTYIIFSIVMSIGMRKLFKVY